MICFRDTTKPVIKDDFDWRDKNVVSIHIALQLCRQVGLGMSYRSRAHVHEFLSNLIHDRISTLGSTCFNNTTLLIEVLRIDLDYNIQSHRALVELVLVSTRDYMTSYINGDDSALRLFWRQAQMKHHQKESLKSWFGRIFDLFQQKLGRYRYHSEIVGLQRASKRAGM